MTSITTLFKKHFDAELLFTDTDSLTYQIKSEDIYEKIFKHLIMEKIESVLISVIKKLLVK